MPPILRILGPEPGVYTPDGEIVLPPGKPYAVLARILLDVTAVTRDDLARTFWPNVPSERGRASVRQALHVLRKALGGVLNEDAGWISVAADAVESDLAELDAALKRGDMEQAFSLWKGGPFASFSLADAPGFNTWSDQLRGRWEQRVGAALEALASDLHEHGDAEGAVLWTERALVVRPYHEQLHRDHVELLLELNQLERAEEVLERALMVIDEPTPGAIEGLRSRILGMRRARIDEAAGETQPELHFVGRTGEMAELRAHWRSVRRGRPRTVALLGEAGVGKTRLAEEFARNTAVDAAVVRAKAIDSERTIELAVIADLIKGLLARPGAAGISNASQAVLQQLVPSMSPAGAGPAPGRPSEAALADALLDLVEAVAHENALLLLIDDLQWADASSRTLLLRTLRSLRGLEVMAIITCRSGDADLSAVRLLRSEASARRALIVELQPLTREEIVEALSLSVHVLPETEAERIAERLQEASHGNPLFLRELVLRLYQEDVILRDDGAWVLPAERMPADLPLPATIREILEARIRALRDDEIHVLARLTTRGADSPEALGRACGLTPRRAQDVVASLLGLGLVVWSGEREIGFAHDSLREVARSILPTGEVAGARRPLRRAAVGIAILAPLAVIATVAALREPPPLYPGLLTVAEGHQIRLYRTPGRRGDAWDTLPALQLPAQVTRGIVSPRRDGSFDIYGITFSEQGVPSAVRVLPDGRVVTLLPHDGDVAIQDVSPDGRYLLLTVADESGPAWRVDIVRYDVQTGEALPVLHAPALAMASWSDDGSTVLATYYGNPDSLVRVRPDGARLGAMEWRRGAANIFVAPCGGRGERAAAFVPTSEGVELLDLDLASGEASTQPLTSVGVFGPPQCSPDGGAVAWFGSDRGERRLIVRDRSSGDTLLGPRLAGSAGVRWIPDRAPPVPIGIRIQEDTIVLPWGSSRTLSAEVSFADGSRDAARDVAWRTEDAGTVSVRNEGTLFANALGTTKVFASVQGWIRDSVTVRVVGSQPTSQALLRDAFEELDSVRWTPYGSPAPIVLPAGEGPGVDLHGDGVGPDGILSRSDFDLTLGATLEVEFQLSLTRRDRQSFNACLVSLDGTPTDPLDRYLDVARRQTLCFSYPVGELARFDPAGIAFSAGGLVPITRRPDLLPPRGWLHVAIVMTPDGQGRLLLDREEVARLDFPVRMGPDVRWRVELMGRAADTRVLVRNLVLWEGARY